MKKYLLSLLMFFIFVLYCTPAFPACTVTDASAGSPLVHTITYDCTGDSSTGAVPATASPYIFGWVFKVETVPGSPAPTDLYDITLTNSNGIDVVTGTLADRSTSAPQEVKPAGNYVAGPLTLNVTNQSVASATFKVIVYYYIEKARE